MNGNGVEDDPPRYASPPQVSEREALEAVVVALSDLPRLARVLVGARREEAAGAAISAEFGIRQELANVVLDQQIRLAVPARLDVLRQRLDELSAEDARS